MLEEKLYEILIEYTNGKHTYTKLPKKEISVIMRAFESGEMISYEQSGYISNINPDKVVKIDHEDIHKED